LLIVAAVAVSLVPSAHAGEAARLCQFAKLAKLVKVTPTQRKVMLEILADLDIKLKGWDIANREKQRHLDGQLTAARESRDMKAICEILNKQTALTAERTDLARPYLDQLIAELDARQRGVWAGHVLFEEMHPRFKRFGLDAGQVNDIRSRCNEAGKAIAELRAKGDAEEMLKVRSQLERDISQDVLTGTQRDRYAGTAGGSGYVSPGRKETEAERTARLRLVVQGFVDARQAADIAKSNKTMKDAANAAISNANRLWREGIMEKPRKDNKKKGYCKSCQDFNRRNKNNARARANRRCKNRNCRNNRSNNNNKNNRNKNKKKNNNKRK